MAFRCRTGPGKGGVVVARALSSLHFGEMTGVVEWIKEFALSLGGPGLFLIAFLDSSFLSFPEVNDLLIVWLTTQHKERMVYYALMTTLGSVCRLSGALPGRPQGR